MITANSSLKEICFTVSHALEEHGIKSVLAGGSAAALHAPQAYTSEDADFVLDDDNSLDEVATALRSIGYVRNGRSRIFIHNESAFTLDFPKGPLAVGGDYVHESHVLASGTRRLRILTRGDCVRDRLAHFYHWNDFTALNAAVAVTVHLRAAIDMKSLRSWTERESANLLEKFAEFERRVAAVAKATKDTK